jgi:outer membrane lipoprotein carrier protein
VKRAGSKFVSFILTAGAAKARGVMNLNLFRLAGLAFALSVAVLSAYGPRVAYANDEALAGALEGLQRHYRETRSFSAKFVEEIAAVGAAKRTRTGTVYFLKPGRMRWEFDEPSKELIVSDGTQLYNYDPELNQVVEGPLAQALRSPGATEFLLGAGDVTKDFKASLFDSAGNGLTNLKLVPKGEGNTVELGLNPENFDVETIRVIDQLGNVTSLKFTNIVNNTPVSDTIFKFAVPPGADIVRPESLK